MQIILHFFTLFLHFSAKIGAFVFIPPCADDIFFSPKPCQNQPKTTPKPSHKTTQDPSQNHARASPKPCGVCASVVGLIVPSFLGAFRHSSGAAEPFGVKHLAARPRFSEPRRRAECSRNYYRLLRRASSAWRSGLVSRGCPAFGRWRGGSHPEIPAAGNLPRFCRPAWAARPLNQPNAQITTHAFLPRTMPPH